MKTKLIFTLIFLLFLGLGSAFGQDIYEPNDTYETATPVNCGDQLSAYIQVAGDVDWYEIEMAESGVLEVAVTSVSDNLDLNVEIYQVIDNVLTLISDDRVWNSGAGENMFSNAVMNAGTYLILIEDEGNNGFSDSDPYQVDLTCTPNALELNQTYEEAADIPSDTCFEANIYGDNHLYTVSNDVDWFKVQINESGVLEVAVTSVPDNLDLNVEIYEVIDNVLTLISDDRSWNSTPGDNLFSNAVIGAGTYLIKVEDEGNSGYNEDTYSFCTTFTPNALELNQVYEEAAPIPSDTCFEANIYGDNHLYTVSNDVDWFELQIDDDNFDLEIAVTSVPDNLDLNVEVYQIIDDVLTLIADDGVWNATPGENMFVSTVVDAGTYLIKVEDEGNSGYNEGNYMFCLSFMGVPDEELENQFGIFPNPSNGAFSIGISNDHLKIFRIDILDQTGRLLSSIENGLNSGNQIILNKPEWSKGIYFVKISTEKGIVIKKVFIQ